jgi:probable rRNA maturation factor
LSIDLYCEIYPEVADLHPIAVEQWQEWFAKWETYLVSEQAIADGEYELSLTITDDLKIQQLNLQYRQQDRPTDVLSFAALESDMPDIPSDDSGYIEPTYLGDIIISQWLAAHGLLHLLGWDHPDDDSLEVMLTQQALMLQLISLHEI